MKGVKEMSRRDRYNNEENLMEASDIQANEVVEETPVVEPVKEIKPEPAKKVETVKQTGPVRN